jgi:general stress protein YciG
VKRTDIQKAMQMMGRKGGRATVSKYGKKKMREWGKLGGRPRKRPKGDDQ